MKLTITALAVAVALVVPSLAFAECAWLLWVTYTEKRDKPDPRKPETEHSIQRAFETQQACERVIAEEVQSQIGTWSRVYERVGLVPGQAALVTAEGVRQSRDGVGKNDLMWVRVSCWPLGLQPRSFRGGAEYPTR